MNPKYDGTKYNLIELAQLAVEYPDIEFCKKGMGVSFFDGTSILTDTNFIGDADFFTKAQCVLTREYFLIEPRPSPIEPKKLYAYIVCGQEIRYFIMDNVEVVEHFTAKRAPEYDIEYPLKAEK